MKLRNKVVLEYYTVYKLYALFMYTDDVCHLNALLTALNQQNYTVVK